jgi:hypothetical protein
MVREEARRTLLREYDKWANDHPDDATKRGGVVFFAYLQKERSDLLAVLSNCGRCGCDADAQGQQYHPQPDHC